MVKRVALAPKLDTAAAADLRLRRRRAAGLHLRMSLADAEGDDIVLDGSAVEMIGALCVETLMSVAAIWSGAGNTVTIEGASPQMIEDLSRLGLSTETLLEYAA